MTSIPQNTAQVKIVMNDLSKDFLHFVDLKNNVLYWFDGTGTGHYIGDGSGATPLPSAIKTIGVGPYVGAPPINLLTLSDSNGNILGWITGAGVSGGTL